MPAFRIMLILLCLLGSSLGATHSYYLPQYSAFPSSYPAYTNFLGSASFPRYYGAAAIPRTGFSYSFGPGYNFQWRSPGQSLNFLPSVTVVDQDEKVQEEEAAKEEVVTQQRFVSRPAPASPESSSSQVLVRQEVESGEETAINRVRGSPKIPAGSVQESQPVFVLRPFINAKVSPHLTSLQTRKTPPSLSYSDRQPGVLLI